MQERASLSLEACSFPFGMAAGIFFPPLHWRKDVTS